MIEPFYCCAHCVAQERLGALAPLVEAAELDGDQRAQLGDALLTVAELAGGKTPLGQRMVDVLLAPIPERAAREVFRRTGAPEWHPVIVEWPGDQQAAREFDGRTGQ